MGNIKVAKWCCRRDEDDYTLVLDTFIDCVDTKPIPEPNSIAGTALVGIGLLVVRRHGKRKRSRV
ncbi:PEP-CTERM sorting domain-containing protein [Aliterella atlantica]|uniref:PEP-CTERM sorting domain-containing protein n=1 Tax=Aliterella atlantica TaxID=1827278 RepID=UPI0009E4E767